MFDLFHFVADCRDALAADKSHKYVREVVARTVSDPSAVIAALGEPQRAGLTKVYQSDDLTILNVVWAPMMTVLPHNHQMWAVIGIYTGREDNIFWRRLTDEPGGRVEAAGARSFGKRDAEPLASDIIHSVDEPVVTPDGRDSRLWRGRFCRVPQRMGSRDAARTELRHREESAPVRGREPSLWQLKSRLGSAGL
jgi:hypothetical protein